MNIRITKGRKQIRLNFISRKITVLKAKKLGDKHELLLRKTRFFLLIPTAFTALTVYSMIEQGLYLLAGMTSFAFVGLASLCIVRLMNSQTRKIRKEEIPKLLR